MSSGRFTLTDSTIENNQAISTSTGALGGGIYADFLEPGVLKRNMIANNQAEAASGWPYSGGGGLLLESWRLRQSHDLSKLPYPQETIFL